MSSEVNRVATDEFNPVFRSAGRLGAAPVKRNIERLVEHMDLAGKTLWQVGAGDTDRSYGKYCKQFDVMIAGPGDLGPYEDSRYAHLGDIRNSLRDFAPRLVPLPTTGDEIKSPELGERLFIEGLPSEYVDKLMAVFASLQRVASWYGNETKRPEGRPSEQETVCYLVVPLLLSLGWSQQTAAVQWHYVDVALFSGMPPTEATLACVVEAKLLGRSVFAPTGQAADYALRAGRENCNRLIVTDGIRYALHRRSAHEFKLEAYLNILNMRDSYPVLGCKGAVEAVLGMAR